MARWPDSQHNNETAASQRSYGQSFYNASRTIGSRISSGKISSFRELWSEASKWRRSNAGSSAVGFDQSRGPSHSGSITPLEDRYGYIRDRYSSRTDGELVESYINIVPPSRRFEITDEIDGQSVPLTTIVLSTHSNASRNSELYQTLRSMGQVTDGNPFHIEHTDPSEVPRIMSHAESLFSRATDPSISNDEALSTLGELHWWTSHAMPDTRGSAAKAELSVRSIAQSRGMDLPPFSKGFVPDLEAMTTARSEFTAKYPASFEWKATSWRSGK